LCTALGGQLVSAGSRTLAGLELDASLHTTQLTFANAQSSFFLTFPTVSGWRQRVWSKGKGRRGTKSGLGKAQLGGFERRWAA